jgi:hypothetical protein
MTIGMTVFGLSGFDDGTEILFNHPLLTPVIIILNTAGIGLILYALVRYVIRGYKQGK